MTQQGGVAVVAGGAGGIGAAVSRKLAMLGTRVAVVDIDEAAAVRLATEISVSGGSAIGLSLDVSKSAEVEQLFDHVEGTLGSIGTLVNVAALFHSRPLLEETANDLDAMFAVNVRGIFNCLCAGGRRMAQRRSGSIVTVASQSSKLVRLGQGLYGASKAASSYLTKCLGLELAQAGIRCNVVHPGVTDTPMSREIWDKGIGCRELHISGNLARHRVGIPLGRVASVDDVANIVLFLVSEQAAHVTMQDIIVDGGSNLIA